MAFDDGKENLKFLMAPNYVMNLTINTKYFDETAHFSGSGAEINNAIQTLFLIEERMLEQIDFLISKETLDTSSNILS